MFDKIWDAIKTHPYIAAGGVLFLIILFYFYSSGSSSSGGTPQAGIYDVTQCPNVIQANAAQAMNTANNNTALSIAQLQAQTQTAATTANNNLLSSYFTDQLDAIQAQYGAAVSINQQNVNGSVAITQCNNATAVALGNQNQVIQQTNAAAAVQINQANDNASVQNSQVAAQSALDLQTNQNSTNLSMATLGLQSQQLGILGSLASQSMSQDAQLQAANLADQTSLFSQGMNDTGYNTGWVTSAYAGLQGGTGYLNTNQSGNYGSAPVAANPTSTLVSAVTGFNPSAMVSTAQQTVSGAQPKTWTQIS